MALQDEIRLATSWERARAGRERKPLKKNPTRRRAPVGTVNVQYGAAAEIGYNELGAILQGLGEQGIYAMHDAIAQAAPVIVKQARRRDYGFKDRRGRLRRSIQFKQEYKRGRGQERIISYIKAGQYALGGDRSPYAHLVERGHAGPKPAPPHPFLSRAVKSRETETFHTMSRYLSRQWPAVLAQVNKRVPKGKKPVGV